MSTVLGVVIMLLILSIIDMVKPDSSSYFIIKITHLIGEILIIAIAVYYYTH